jgi:hypothetical protein
MRQKVFLNEISLTFTKLMSYMPNTHKQKHRETHTHTEVLNF